jgi:hypothetical protein
VKTAAWTEALARGPIAVPPHAVARSLGVALPAGLAIATLAMLVVLGPRPDLGRAIGGLRFWIKLAYPCMLALVALVAAARLSRPGGRAPLAVTAALAIAAALVMAAVTALAGTPAGTRVGLAFGHSALSCVTDVALLALPLFIATICALRTLAPTRLRAAGAAAGLLAGSGAAAVYAWHCDETALAFVGLWYTLAMAVPSAIGAWLGPRTLRWS